MADKTYPDARLTAQGDVVDIHTDVSLPNFAGTVLADLGGRIYVLWRYADGNWDVVNPGGVIVQTALDKFIKEQTS
jgi:hypothetical protein